MKDVNRYTSNEFHDWQRDNLPDHFVIQDLDTWRIVFSNSSNDYEPLCLVELKRSFYEPEQWTPFHDDLPNYMALFKLAKKANLPLVIIYFKKGKNLTDIDTKLAIFKVSDVSKNNDDWITYQKTIITSEKLKEEFPNILI